jgi:hypothetical protein
MPHFRRPKFPIRYMNWSNQFMSPFGPIRYMNWSNQ